MVTSAMRFTLTFSDDTIREHPLQTLVDVEVLQGERRISVCFAAYVQPMLALTMWSGLTRHSKLQIGGLSFRNGSVFTAHIKILSVSFCESGQ